MAIINTGAVERNITGVNESEAFRRDSRTNLLPYSEDFSNANWSKNDGTTITNNYATSPYGTLNASRYLGTETSGLGDKFTLGLADYTISFWVKSNNGLNQFCRLIGDSSQVSSDILVTTEWNRISYTFTASGLSNKTNGIFRDSSNNDIDILIYGAQLEEGSEATEYIPTNGAPVTIDNNSTSTVTNTGVVEREIEASHDANFVHPLGDELVTNGDFSDGTNDWNIQGSSSIIIDSYEGRSNVANINILSTSGSSRIEQGFDYVNGSKYKIYVDVYLVSGSFRLDCRDSFVSGDFVSTTTTGSWLTLEAEVEANATGTDVLWLRSLGEVSQFYVSKVSIKEVLVNRESTVTNTGVTIRDIEGINESDEMFPDNTQSSVLNVGEEILPLLESLESRATYYENEENTINILKNLNC
jgi:hypothetical protein